MPQFVNNKNLNNLNKIEKNLIYYINKLNIEL